MILSLLPAVMATSVPDIASQIAASLHAAAGTRVIVADIRGMDGAPIMEARWLSDELTSALFGQAGLVVLDRSRLDEILKEMERQQSVSFDIYQSESAHKQMGADLLLVGTLIQLPGDDRVYVRAVNVETGEIQKAMAFWLTDENEAPVSVTPSLPTGAAASGPTELAVEASVVDKPATSADPVTTAPVSDYFERDDNYAAFRIGGGVVNSESIAPIVTAGADFGFEQWYMGGITASIAPGPSSLDARVMAFAALAVPFRGARPSVGFGGHIGTDGGGYDLVAGLDLRIRRWKPEKGGGIYMGSQVDAGFQSGGNWSLRVDVHAAFGAGW